MTFSYYSGFSTPAYIRGIIFSLFLFFGRKYIRINRTSFPFFLFFIWIIFLMFLSNEFLYSFKYVIQVVFSMSMFIIAYEFFDSKEKLFHLLKGLYWILIITIIAVAIGYIFKIGQIGYQAKDQEEEPFIGLLTFGGLYAPGTVLAITPLILKTDLSSLQRKLLPFVVVVLFIFLLLTVRRTVILIPIIGLLGFLLYSKHKFKILGYSFLVIAFLFALLPLYEDILSSRFKVRENAGRFEEDFYKTEMRYIENIQMIEDIGKFENPTKIIFGIGNNIFAENITDGQVSGRMFHTDIAKLFYGIGIFGIIIYLLIYFKLYLKIRNIPSNGYLNDYKSAALGLLLISLFVSINGSITVISFRAANFLLLGAILGYVKSEAKQKIFTKNKKVESHNGLFTKQSVTLT